MRVVDFYFTCFFSFLFFTYRRRFFSVKTWENGHNVESLIKEFSSETFNLNESESIGLKIYCNLKLEQS